MHSGRRSCLRALAMVAASTRVANATDDVSEAKLSVAVGPALPLGKAAERWIEHLQAPGDAPVAAKLHPGASLAGRDPARELPALRDGLADLAVGSALQWSLQVPSFGVFALPWRAPEDRQLDAIARDPAVLDLLRARLAAAGAHLVALAPLGYREIATIARPIRAPEDLAGLRLRAAPSPLLHDVLRSLGAVPQTMPYAEAQGRFARRELDGQEGAPTALAAAGVTSSGHRHVTDLGGVGDAMVFAVRAATWASWTPAQRQRAAAAATRAVAETDALGREQAALRQLAAQGAAVLRLTSAGQQAFRAAVRDADARWQEVVGADVVRAADSAAAAAK